MESDFESAINEQHFFVSRLCPLSPWEKGLGIEVGN